jgi:hypothetical protein
MNALADLITVGDSRDLPKDGTIPPELKRKIEKVLPACSDDLQKKLMQGQS